MAGGEEVEGESLREEGAEAEAELGVEGEAVGHRGDAEGLQVAGHPRHHVHASLRPEGREGGVGEVHSDQVSLL